MKMYFIYHIPGKKIGVTNDLQNRVEKQQGYEEDEYEVLEMSEDINYISERELELHMVLPLFPRKPIIIYFYSFIRYKTTRARLPSKMRFSAVFT